MFIKSSLTKKFFRIIVCSLFSILCLVEPVFSEENENAAILKNQIKEEIYKEILDEIHAAIKEEVAAEFRNYFTSGATPIDLENISVIYKNNDFKFIIHQLVENEILRKHELYKSSSATLTDGALDTYHASGVNSEASIVNGLKKSLPADKTTFIATENPVTKIDDNTLDNTTAGEEKPEAIERVLQQRGSMLLPKGTFQIEPGVAYSHFSTNRINVDGLLLLDVFAVGEIATESIQRDIFIENFGLKYGLTHNFQLEGRIPLRQEHDRFTKTSGTESTDYSSGIGDIEFSASRQIGWEDGWMPDLIANLAVKTPSGRDPYNRNIGMGTGHWAMRGSLIAAKSSDPVVIFGSFSYAYNLGRDNIENLGDIDPGDTVGYSFGTAIALSYKTAINFAFSHSITTKTHRNGDAIPGTFLNVAALKIGLNWALSERASIDCGVHVGITESAPDLTLEIRFPITF